jgi:hypothetical protein
MLTLTDPSATRAGASASNPAKRIVATTVFFMVSSLNLPASASSLGANSVSDRREKSWLRCGKEDRELDRRGAGAISGV